MTGQMSDEFRYEGELYNLAGLDGEGLYTPESFGMQTFSTCTACWRGYILYYDCVDSELILDAMEVNTNEPIAVNGIEPSDSKRFFKYRYDDLKLKTPFTGTILLAKDFIQDMYVHMGFQRAMAYETVIELHVLNGDIIVARDLSELMAKRRQEDRDKDAQPRSPEDPDLREWIGKSFSLEYDPPDDE